MSATTVKKNSTLAAKVGRKFLLHPREALLLCRMGFWVSILSLAAKLYPLPAALRIVSPKRRSSERKTVEGVQASLAQAIDLLLSTNIFIFKPSCWKRATILHRYLALNGVSARIVFGVRKEINGGLSGHAWLEVAGRPILESAPPPYTVTYTFPSADVCAAPLTLFTGEEQ